MIQRSLNILDHLIRENPARENRSTDLLKDPSVETAEGWFMCVPACFNNTLDIKLTKQVKDKKKSFVWTQGSSFSFKTGYIVYDTADAYKVWSEALKSINLCVQIKTASDAIPSERGSDRFPGSVTFCIMTPNRDRSKIVERGEHTMSQDGFVRFLIAGPPNDLKTKIGKPQQEN